MLLRVLFAQCYAACYAAVVMALPHTEEQDNEPFVSLHPALREEKDGGDPLCIPPCPLQLCARGDCLWSDCAIVASVVDRLLWWRCVCMCVYV